MVTDPSHGRAKIAAIYVKVFVIDDDNLLSSPAGGANMETYMLALQLPVGLS